MPFGCALFEQYSRLPLDQVEPEIAQKLKERNLTYCVFNKGL